MRKFRKHSKLLGICLWIVYALSFIAANQDDGIDSADNQLDMEKRHTLQTNSNQQSRYRGIITQCGPPGTDGYFISTEYYSRMDAEKGCFDLGGYLVDLSTENFLLASDLILTCLGPHRKAWDQVNHGAPNGPTCISLLVGNIGPGGTIDNTCEEERPALCQLRIPIKKPTS
ncbi:hypothetical protein BDB01DRAFT_779324 [Pilobolus umbonatus]|nr:hypothetical protein BDB01DRAFT_779324 [Pilobolus umbonatus]